MLCAGSTQPGPVVIGAGIINALSLSDGIEAQDQVSQLSEGLAAELIGVSGLAVARMAHLEQDSGKWRLKRERNVEIRRYMQIGLALIEDLLDAVAVAIERAQFAD